ncbi:MAG: IS1595 family transposase [Xanthobacteraceae bacterium]
MLCESMLSRFESLIDLLKTVPTEQSCLDHVRAIRWRDGEYCPHCGGTRIYHLKDKKNFQCGKCRAQLSIKVGTIFHDTNLPLRKWFMATQLITNHPRGIASTKVAKNLGITQKTAWFVRRRIRHATRTRSFNISLKRTVKIDQTDVDSDASNRYRKGPRGKVGPAKTTVIGAGERLGDRRQGWSESRRLFR